MMLDLLIMMIIDLPGTWFLVWILHKFFFQLHYCKQIPTFSRKFHFHVPFAYASYNPDKVTKL